MSDYHQLQDLPVAERLLASNQDLTKRWVAPADSTTSPSSIHKLSSEAGGVRQETDLLQRELFDEPSVLSGYGALEKQWPDSDDQEHRLSDFKVLWFLLGVLGMRPYGPKAPAVLYYVLNVMICVFQAASIYATGFSIVRSAHDSYHVSNTAYVIISIVASIVNLVMVPVCHFLAYRITSNPTSLRALMRYGYYDDPVRQRALEVIRAHTSVNGPMPEFDSWKRTPRENFERDLWPIRSSLIVAASCVAMALIVLGFTDFNIDPTLKVVLLIIAAWTISISWIMLTFFLLGARIFKRHIDMYLMRVVASAFPTAEDMFNFHLSFRSSFTLHSRYFRVYATFTLINTAVHAVASATWAYGRLTPWGSRSVVTQAMMVTIASAAVISGAVLFAWCIAHVNDTHAQLKRAIVTSRAFTIHERMDLVAQIEMFPIAFDVAGIRLDSTAFARIFASLVIAFIPIIAKVVFL